MEYPIWWDEKYTVPTKSNSHSMPNKLPHTQKHYRCLFQATLENKTKIHTLSNVQFWEIFPTLIAQKQMLQTIPNKTWIELKSSWGNNPPLNQGQGRTSTVWLMDLLTSWPVVYPHYIRTDFVSTSMAGDWKKHKIRSINRNRNTVKNFGENMWTSCFSTCLRLHPGKKGARVTFLFGCLTNTTPPSESP